MGSLILCKWKPRLKEIRCLVPDDTHQERSRGRTQTWFSLTLERPCPWTCSWRTSMEDADVTEERLKG